MAIRPLQKLGETAMHSTASAWLDELDHQLDQVTTDRALLCRNVLTDLMFPEYAKHWETAVQDRTLPHATRLALSATDPRNITLEPEYYADCTQERF
jgi:hypothetical protein